MTQEELALLSPKELRESLNIKVSKPLEIVKFAYGASSGFKKRYIWAKDLVEGMFFVSDPDHFMMGCRSKVAKIEKYRVLSVPYVLGEANTSFTTKRPIEHPDESDPLYFIAEEQSDEVIAALWKNKVFDPYYRAREYQAYIDRITQTEDAFYWS